MIISRGRSYIFVHIPKTGGTSMALALEARAMKDDIMLGDTPKARNRRRRVRATPESGRLWKHSTLTDINGLATPQEMSQMFCFTMVRNPWDRVVSYYHWLRAQHFDHPAARLARDGTFEAFLGAREVQSSLHATPAPHYMTDASGSVQCDSYIRLEHFSSDAEPLWAHLGFELELPWVNASKRDRDYRGYYSKRMRETVRQCCAADISRFGYDF
ncbi:MAG: sulfotransferase family 2 domain-containing protein [Pseudomonadota bacterium]